MGAGTIIATVVILAVVVGVVVYFVNQQQAANAAASAGIFGGLSSLNLGSLSTLIQQGITSAEGMFNSNTTAGA
jgi:hypothetical protein